MDHWVVMVSARQLVILAGWHAMLLLVLLQELQLEVSAVVVFSRNITSHR